MFNLAPVISLQHQCARLLRVLIPNLTDHSSMYGGLTLVLHFSHRLFQNQRFAHHLLLQENLRK